MTSKKYLQGFTLIEVLVVIVIISIILGLAVININPSSPTEKLQTEAARLARLIELAGEEAVLSSQHIGIQLSDNGYRFMVYRDNDWKELEDKFLKSYHLPEEIEFTLLMEEVKIDTGDDNKNKERPNILAFSNGELTPFEITLRSQQHEASVILSGNALGTLTLETKLGL